MELVYRQDSNLQGGQAGAVLAVPPCSLDPLLLAIVVTVDERSSGTFKLPAAVFALQLIRPAAFTDKAKALPANIRRETQRGTYTDFLPMPRGKQPTRNCHAFRIVLH